MSTLSQTICNQIRLVHKRCMPGHVGGYLPPYFKSKMKRPPVFPLILGLRGLFSIICLSCDESVREAIDQTRSWLLQDEKLEFLRF